MAERVRREYGDGATVERLVLGASVSKEDGAQRNTGLIRAVEKFDPEMGNRFSIYQMRWIRQAGTRVVTDHAPNT